MKNIIHKIDYQELYPWDCDHEEYDIDWDGYNHLTEEWQNWDDYKNYLEKREKSNALLAKMGLVPKNK